MTINTPRMPVASYTTRWDSLSLSLRRAGARSTVHDGLRLRESDVCPSASGMGAAPPTEVERFHRVRASMAAGGSETVAPFRRRRANSMELRPLLVDAKDAARLLGIGRTTLYGLMKAGAITPVRIGRCVRFSVAELERFVGGGCTVEADTSSRPKPGKATAHGRPARRGVLREVTPRLFDPAS